MRIILDANFLIYTAKQKIDYAKEISSVASKYKIVVLSSVIEELKKLKEKARKSKDKEAASLALQILKKNIENKKVGVVKTEGNADKAIQILVREEDLVATMDKGLKNKLKGKAKILSIRSKKNLEII